MFGDALAEIEKGQSAAPGGRGMSLLGRRGLLACPTPSLKAPMTFIILAIIPPVTLADSVYLKSARPFALEQSKHTTPKRRVLAFMGTSLTGRSDCEIAASRTRLDRQGPFDETQGQLSFLYLYLPRASSSLLYFSFRLFFMRADTSSMARIEPSGSIGFALAPANFLVSRMRSHRSQKVAPDYQRLS